MCRARAAVPPDSTIAQEPQGHPGHHPQRHRDGVSAVLAGVRASDVPPARPATFADRRGVRGTNGKTEHAPSTQLRSSQGCADAAPALPQCQPFPQFPPWQSCVINQRLHLITTGRHEVAAKMEIAKLTSDCLNRERVVTVLRFGYTTAAAPARQEAAWQHIAPQLGGERELARGKRGARHTPACQQPALPAPLVQPDGGFCFISKSAEPYQPGKRVRMCASPSTLPSAAGAAVHLLSASRCC